MRFGRCAAGSFGARDCAGDPLTGNAATLRRQRPLTGHPTGTVPTPIRNGEGRGNLSDPCGKGRFGAPLMTTRRQIRIAGALALGAGAALAARAYARRGRGGPDDRRAAYEPVNTLKPVSEGIWIVDGEPIHAMGLVLPVRMTVVRLAGGDLLLHSPVEPGPELARAVGRLGPVRHLLAPTTAHWKFLKDWQSAFPEATSWAVPGLGDRLQVRASSLRIDRELGEVAPAEWSPTVRQGLVRGPGFCEAFLFHQPSRTLVLADLVQNMEPARLPPVSAAVARLARATAAGPAAHIRLILTLGGRRSREDVRRMVALEPEKVVFAHGRWFAGNGSERLRRAFKAFL